MYIHEVGSVFLSFLDIDECRESGNSICANGKCENSPGSYKCTCNPGYELSPDGTFCIGSILIILLVSSYSINSYIVFVVI